MWPYNDDEAGWLAAGGKKARSPRRPVNDNDPRQRIPVRLLTAPTQTRKPGDET